MGQRKIFVNEKKIELSIKIMPVDDDKNKNVFALLRKKG